MLSFSQFNSSLIERWITSDDHSEKSRHHDEIHSILKSSYKDIGGYGGHGHNTKAEHEAISSDIHNPNHIIKINRHDDKITSAAIYKKQHGRKIIALGTNGTIKGKQHLNDMIKSDHTQKRAWGELSGAAEHLYRKHGAPEISSHQVEHLTGKTVLQHNPDNSYVRRIGGELHTKRLLGHPQSS